MPPAQAITVRGTDLETGVPITLKIELPPRWPGYDERTRRHRDARGRFARGPWRLITRIEVAP